MGLGSMSGSISTSRGYDPRTGDAVSTISESALPVYPSYPVDMRMQSIQSPIPANTLWLPVLNTTSVATYTTASSLSATSTPTTTATSSKPPLGNVSSHFENISQHNCEGRHYFESIVANMESMRKSNERFQSNVLNELTQLRHSLIDLREAISDLPLKIAEAITLNRSRSVSYDSEIELIDHLSNIELTSKSSGDDRNDRCDEHLDNELSNETKRETGPETKNNGGVLDLLVSNNSARVDTNKVNHRCVSINGKVIFEYSPELDMDKWLKKN